MIRLAAALFLALAMSASAGAGLHPQVGARVDPAARVVEADGTPAALGELLAPGGTLLVLGYHRCENICGILQAALAETLAELGDPPRVLFASLDPDEGPSDAEAMRASLRQAVPGANLSDWHFLTGRPEAIAAVSRPMGIETYIRPGGEVLVHPVAVGVLTPAGALSEVFYGLDFTAAGLTAALDAAARGEAGGLRERVLLLCSGLDAAVGQVARAAWDGVRLAGLATLVLLAVGLYRLTRERRR